MSAGVQDGGMEFHLLLVLDQAKCEGPSAVVGTATLHVHGLGTPTWIPVLALQIACFVLRPDAVVTR